MSKKLTVEIYDEFHDHENNNFLVLSKSYDVSKGDYSLVVEKNDKEFFVIHEKKVLDSLDFGLLKRGSI